MHLLINKLPDTAPISEARGDHLTTLNAMEGPSTFGHQLYPWILLFHLGHGRVVGIP